MRSIITAISISIAAPAMADCTAEIAGMFDGGPLDAYQRPPHRHEKQVIDANGTATITFTSIVETPLRGISGAKDGPATLTIDDATWSGPGPDGPWIPTDNNNPKDRAPWHKAMQAQQAKNLTETECPGVIVFEGNKWLSFRFATKTDPNPDMGNAFYGSTNSVYVDPYSMQVMRWEQSGLFSSWLPEPGPDTHITTYRYDPSIRVMNPD